MFIDAQICLNGLRGKAGFWLADLSIWLPMPNDESVIDYTVFGYRDFTEQYGSDSGDGDDIRTNQRAIRRLNAYRSAFESIRNQRLDELAKAWWAFFIASQAIAFRGFGLPATQIADIVDIAGSLMPDEAVRRALRFAIKVTEDHGSPLQLRIAKSVISRILRNSSQLTENEIIHLNISKSTAAAYLEKALGAKTWAALGERSRDDLIEAEQLWGRTAFEFGAGRSDWGGLVGYYSRAIEREVRNHIGPLVNELQKIGVCQVNELTLGGCVKVIREAKNAIRKSDALLISEPHRLAVKKLHDFFTEQHSFIEAYRNRAVHGNEEKPITNTEFANWRSMMFDGKLFTVIIESWPQ